MIVGQEKPSLDDLVHHGVLGMKWGHRKQKELDRANRIASGTASTIEKARFRMNVSLADLAKNKGSIKRIAAGRAFVLQAQKDRIESGNATKRDKLDRALNTSLIDLARGR